MIPFRDDNPSGSTPYVTITLIVLNVLVFLHEARMDPYQRRDFVLQWALQPREVVETVRGEPTPGQKVPVLVTPFSSMFMHANLIHLLGNMLYLWIFGDNVEDRMGHLKYLIFYGLCGFGAGMAHLAFNPASPVPTVGASGAIAGVLGAYLLAFPRARVSTLVALGFIWTVIRLPAQIVLGFWFVIQFLSGLSSLRVGSMGGGTAWWAHIGGFVLGMGLLFVFQKPQAKRRPYQFYR